MLSQLIENSLHKMDTSTVTDVFIVITIVLLILSIIWTKQNKHHQFTNYAPSLLTSVGILGTFTGIVIGLLDFKVDDIDGSINLLLEGLKVAFITSLIGMLSSILLKFLTSSNIISPPNKEEIADDISLKDLYSVMKNQNENIIKVQELLSDSADSSLIGQIKLMRSDISDNNKIINKNLENIELPLAQINSKQDKQIELLEKPLILLEHIDKSINNSNELLDILNTKQVEQQKLFEIFSKDLWKQLENFADLLSKSATEQIIEALKNVIKEFNDKLTEQFGQNFKELNSAVKDLVTWQGNYKEQLGEMKEQFNLSVTSMSDMEKSIELISTNSKTIPESMNSLEHVMTINQHQINELSNHLEAFKDIRDKAVEAVPKIRTQIDTTIQGIQEASQELIQGVTKSTDKITTVMVQNADDFANNVNVTNGALVETSNTLTKSSTDIKDQLNLTVQDISKYIRIMVEDLSKSSTEISSNFREVGTTLESELTKTNKSMMDNLKSVSKELSITSKDINSTISTISSELQNSIETLSKAQQKETKKTLEGLDLAVQKTIDDTSKSLSKQINIMDKVAEKEIENIMNAMGKSLVSITRKFTDDYQVLVKEMQKVIESHR